MFCCAQETRFCCLCPRMLCLLSTFVPLILISDSLGIWQRSIQENSQLRNADTTLNDVEKYTL
jgi:hypothetical protein